MTVIKRNPNESKSVSRPDKGVRLPQDVGPRVLRNYVVNPDVLVPGQGSVTAEEAYAVAFEEPVVPMIDIAAAQDQIHQFQQESRQRIQAEVAETRRKAKDDLARELADMKADFERDLTQQKARVMEESYEKGFAKGEEDGKSQYAASIRDVFNAVERVGKEKEAFLEKSQEEILALSLRAAKKMVLAELTQSPDVLLGIVMDAIRRITDKDKVIIKLNSKDAAHMRQHQAAIFAQMPDIKSLEIHDDARVDEGGCVIETRLGYIDATLETKVTILEKAFAKAAEDH
jgi:flagellar assembly protein FliH